MWIMLGAEWTFNSFILGLLAQAVETVPEEDHKQERSQAEVGEMSRNRFVRSETK